MATNQSNSSDEEDLLDSDKSNSCLQTSNAEKENMQSTLGPDDEALLLSSPSQSPEPKTQKQPNDVTDENHLTNKITLPEPKNQPESAHVISDDDGDDDDVVILDDDVNFNRAKFPRPHIVSDDDEDGDFFDSNDSDESDEMEDEEDEESTSSEESFSDDSDMNNDMSDYLDGKIKIFYTHGSFFLWNGEDVQMLREECRIVGKLTGCLPRAPRQNNQLGLPLQLMPEEAKLLVDIDAAVVVEEDPVDEEVLSIRQKAFREVREENYKIQQKLYEECRKEEVSHRFRDIIAGKRAKKRKLMQETNTLKVSSVEPSTVSVTCDEESKEPTDTFSGIKGHAMDQADKLTDEEKKKVESVSSVKSNEVEDEPMDETDKLTVKDKHNENSQLKNNCEDVQSDLMGKDDQLSDQKNAASLSKSKLETDKLTAKEKENAASSLKDKPEIIEDDVTEKLTDKENAASSLKDQPEVIEDDETDKLTEKDNAASSLKDQPEIIEDDSTDETDKLTVQDIVKSETSANHALVQIFTENPWKHSVHVYEDWEYPNTQKELIRYLVFKDLWRKGFFLTSGSKFGGDFLVYPGDPSRYHSHYIAICKNQYDEIPSQEIVTLGRLASNVRKTALLCSIDRNRKVLYTSIKWTGIT